MNGTHRQDGIFIATGGSDQCESSALAPESLSGVAAALARAMGLLWSPGNGEGASGDLAYSQEESEMVAARLRALGYID
jgi:hypothetical protein